MHKTASEYQVGETAVDLDGNTYMKRTNSIPQTATGPETVAIWERSDGTLATPTLLFIQGQVEQPEFFALE